MAKADTDITTLIRRTLQAAGQTDATAVTAFTDGCPGLRSILADAGVTKPPIADRLSPDNPDRVQAKAVMMAEVERLRWRIWNGKAKNAQRSIERICQVMPAFKDEQDHRGKGTRTTDKG